MLAAVFNFGSPALADELGRPPATLNISDDAKPIDFAQREAPETRSSRDVKQNSVKQNSVKQNSAQWSSGEASIVGDGSSAWKLRWRQPTNVSQPFAEEPKPLAVSRAVVWNQTDERASLKHSAVRTVAQLAPVDPFEEPYPGQSPNKPDRSGPNRNDTFNTLQPRPTPPGTTPKDVPQPMPADSPLTPESATPMPERDLAPVPPGDLGTTDPLLAPIPKDMPCARTYDGRNCCVDEAKCRQAQQFVAQYKISSILLDITPTFTNTDSPTNANFVPTEVRKEENLAKAPSRTWKNRADATIAEGRFADYRNGVVHVLGDGGEKVELSFSELSDDDVCFVTAWWSLPSECSLAKATFQQRDWLASTFTWKASALCHKPLYFEEVALERYGHSVGPIKQPFVSGAHFFGSLAALPYQMGMHPPNECQYALGYYRPGSCAPWLVPPIPVSIRGALAEAGAWIGGIYIIP